MKEIQIFNTILQTPDNKIVIVPNTQLATSTLINYTRSGKRRLDISVGIAYGADINKAREVLIAKAAEYPSILSGEGEKPEVVVTSLGASSIDLQLRVWVNAADYWPVSSSLTQSVYETLGSNGIEIPFNQLQVHINK